MAEEKKPYDREDIARTESGQYEVISQKARWNWGQIGARVTPDWWNILRQVVIFILGIFCVLYVILTPGANLILLIVGLVLIGIVPVDALILSRFGHKVE